MKIWNGFGSEHSMNLVLIGKFKEIKDAERAKILFDLLTAQVSKEQLDFIAEASDDSQRFSDDMLKLLRDNNIYSLSTSELGQFVSDHRVSQEKNQITITTDEVDVSAFVKILLDERARVELYSAHDYPEVSDISE